ncbi:hypothetical protein ACMFMG_010680 [Clarireedia jacksonii]
MPTVGFYSFTSPSSTKRAPIVAHDLTNSPIRTVTMSSDTPYTCTTPINSQSESESLLSLATSIIRLLSSQSSTVAAAESLTGGSLMAALTAVPGSSAAFRGGVVSYATSVKESLLNVDRQIIKREGVVCEEVAAQMAEGVRGATSLGRRGDERDGEGGDERETTWGISTTGVAGPGMQDGKPVGTVYVGVAWKGGGEGLGTVSF